MRNVTYDPTIKISVGIIGTVVSALILIELQHILIPLVIAYMLFFIFEPLNVWLQKKKIPQFITVIIDLLIIIGFIWGISRIIIGSFSKFGEQLPFYEQKLNNIVKTSAANIGLTDPFFANFNLKEYLIGLDYGGIAGGVFDSTISLVSGGFFVLFFFIFISSGHKRINDVVKKRYIKIHTNRNFSEASSVSESGEDYVEKTFRDITSQVQKYLATKFYISLVLGLFIAVILWIFGVDFLVVWAVLTFLLNFIPTIGSIIAVLLPTLMTLVQYESFGTALIVALILIGIQNIIGNIIEPKIMGERLGLNPLVVLLSLLLWGYIWGVVGMILSIPLTSIMKIIMERSDSTTLHFLSDLMGTD